MSNAPLPSDPLEKAIQQRADLLNFAGALKALVVEYSDASEPLRHLLNEILNEDSGARLQRFIETECHLAACDFVSCSYGNYLDESETRPKLLAQYLLMRLGEALSKGDSVAYQKRWETQSKAAAVWAAAREEFPAFTDVVLTRKYKALQPQFRERAEALALSYGHPWSWHTVDKFKNVGVTFSQLEIDAFRHWLDYMDAHAVYADGFLQGLGWRPTPPDAGINAANPSDEDEQLTQEQCDERPEQFGEGTAESERVEEAVDPRALPKISGDFVLTFSGEIVFVRAFGEEGCFTRIDGWNVLAKLLGNPGKPVTYAEILGTAQQQIHDPRSVQPVGDPEYLKRVHDELTEAKEDVENAQEGIEKEEAVARREKLLAHLRSLMGKGGKDRDLNDPDVKPRNTINGRLKSVYKKLREVEEPLKQLADHLENSISAENGAYSYSPVSRPESPAPVWKILR